MRILVIKPSSLGDIVHSLPFLKVIRDTFQDAHIEWVISKSLKDILEGNPLINALIVFDKDSWNRLKNISTTVREALALIRRLKTEHYDMVVDLQGLLRSGLMTFFSRSPVKIGFDNAREGSWLFYNRRISVNPVRDLSLNGVNNSIHAVDRYLEIAKAIQKSQKSEDFGELSRAVRSQKSEKIEFPLYIDKTAKEDVKRLLGKIKEKEYFVIVPSARWETKRWPSENFGMLISKISIPCVITGSSADRQVVRQVMASSNGKGIDLCDKTSLKELVALIAGAKAIVSNDSGPMHIGVALGVPIIALFGPSDPVRTGPYGWSETPTEQVNKNLKVIRAPVPCSPCFKKKCKAPLCMSGISVERVFEEMKEYL